MKRLKSKGNIAFQIKSFIIHYAEACNEIAEFISASFRPDSTAPFEEMSQRWRAVGSTASNLTGQRFEL